MAHFEYKNINGLNFVQVHDVFTPQQMSMLWTVYEYTKEHFGGGEVTGAARYEDGTSKKNNRGYFICSMEPQPKLVDEVRRIVSEGLMLLSPSFPIDSVFRSAEMANRSSLLMQYYLHDGEGYDAHKDQSVFTSLFFFNRDEKNFRGGDIYFPEFNVSIPFMNNCGIIFPGVAEHKVEPVTQINRNIDTGGRLSLALLSNI